MASLPSRGWSCKGISACRRINPSYLPNHNSWEEAEVKAKLGPKMALYFVQGVIEFIAPGMEMSTVIEPMGAVPKKGKDKYRTLATSRSRTGARGCSRCASWQAPCRGGPS